MAAWALTEEVKVRRKTEAMRDFENISRIGRECMNANR
jgi:hypothetical protein